MESSITYNKISWLQLFSIDQANYWEEVGLKYRIKHHFTASKLKIQWVCRSEGKKRRVCMDQTNEEQVLENHKNKL